MECLLPFGTVSVVLQFAVKKYKIKIYRIIMLPVVLYECKTWCVFEEGTCDEAF
jgi:hypothetical protein